MRNKYARSHTSTNSSSVKKFEQFYFIPGHTTERSLCFIVFFILQNCLIFFKTKNSFTMALYCEHDIMPYDRPIQIVSPDSNHAFTPDNFYTIERLLSSDDLRNRKIVVVSIAGALRKGKSFLLNYFLKYLNAQVRTKCV